MRGIHFYGQVVLAFVAFPVNKINKWRQPSKLLSKIIYNSPISIEPLCMPVLNSLGDIHNRLKVKIAKFKAQFYPHKIAKINKRSVF